MVVRGECAGPGHVKAATIRRPRSKVAGKPSATAEVYLESVEVVGDVRSKGSGMACDTPTYFGVMHAYGQMVMQKLADLVRDAARSSYL